MVSAIATLRTLSIAVLLLIAPLVSGTGRSLAVTRGVASQQDRAAGIACCSCCQPTSVESAACCQRGGISPCETPTSDAPCDRECGDCPCCPANVPSVTLALPAGRVDLQLVDLTLRVLLTSDHVSACGQKPLLPPPKV